MVLEKLSIGQRIALCRKEKDLSQRDLAKILNVTPSSVSRWENGFKKPDQANALMLAKILEKPADYFYEKTISQYNNATEIELKLITGMFKNQIIYAVDSNNDIIKYSIHPSEVIEHTKDFSKTEIKSMLFVWINRQDKYIVKRCSEYEGGAMYLVYEDYELKAMDLSDRKENGQSSNFRVVGKLLKLIRELD